MSEAKPKRRKPFVMVHHYTINTWLFSLTEAEYRVFFALKLRQNYRTGACCPSLEIIAATAKLTVSQVRSAIKKMRDRRLITIEKRRDTRGILRNHYIFNPETEQPEDQNSP